MQTLKTSTVSRQQKSNSLRRRPPQPPPRLGVGKLGKLPIFSHLPVEIDR